MKNLTNKHYFLFVALLIIGILVTLTSNKLQAAVSLENTKFNVDVQINQDSTFTVKENIAYKAYGDFHGLRRDIRLNQYPEITQRCLNNPGVTCGGFDRLIPIAAYDQDGNKLGGQFKLYNYEEEDSEVEYARFEWEIYPNGKNVNGEEYEWTIEYLVLGGIEWFNSRPIFYWNLLPESRGTSTKEVNISIKLPSDVSASARSFEVYDSFLEDADFSGNEIRLSERNYPNYLNMTVAYSFNTNEILKPASLAYNVSNPQVGIEVYLNDILINESASDILDFIPSGNQKIRFAHSGYIPYESTLNFTAGTQETLEINLTPEPWMQVLLLINNIVFIGGCILIPVIVGGIYLFFNRNGRDKKPALTIIPLFEPPTGVRPYLLGTLKDETVDKEDIIGSIIDLAYRGYIKIKELNIKDDYELTRLQGNPKDEGLSDNEKYLLDAIFNGKEVINTSAMRYHFPLKYSVLQKKIYTETVNKGYFKNSPETTRAMYFSLSILVIVFGFVLLIMAGIILTGILGYLIFFTPAFALIAGGVTLLAFAKYMPAKTELGSKVLGDIRGFKMYLHTAERYRLQNLGPQEFERFLSYAVVFKIEKEWAKKFEGIYKGQPDWFESSSGLTVWDAYVLSSMIRNFSSSTLTNMTPVPSSGSSFKGGGWSSGGGSFGGFSGGGGGGGSSGGW
jgi:uncharacterized membrane protein YgcG